MGKLLVHFEDQDFEFELEDIDLAQAKVIKRQTGMTVKQFIDGAREIDPDCVGAAYWLMKAQNGVAVDMNKINFKVLKFADALGEAIEREAEENPTQESAETPATT